MKKRIEEKLEKNIERILGKEELLPSDVAILKEKLIEIKTEEDKESHEEKKKEMLEFMNKLV